MKCFLGSILPFSFLCLFSFSFSSSSINAFLYQFAFLKQHFLSKQILISHQVWTTNRVWFKDVSTLLVDCVDISGQLISSIRVMTEHRKWLNTCRWLIIKTVSMTCTTQQDISTMLTCIITITQVKGINLFKNAESKKKL